MRARFHDWPRILEEHLRERMKRRFKWGRYEHDCCSFAFGVARALTGYDALANIPDYSTADEADLILGEHPIEQHCDEHFQRCTSVGLARRGDLALVEVKGDFALMIVEGPTVIGAGATRLERYPRARMLKAWMV